MKFSPTEEDKTFGFIAQEIEEVVPDSIREAPFADKMNKTLSWEDKYKTVKSDKVIPILVEAVKEQQETIDELKCQVSQLLARCA